jgi:hypothetical protein
VVPAVAALVVALSLGGSPRARPLEARQAAPLAGSNAARARVGLLPRKAPPRAAAREGRRIIRTTSLKPAFLGEPGTLTDLDTLPPPPPPPPAPEDPGRFRLSARGVTTDVTISMRFDR